MIRDMGRGDQHGFEIRGQTAKQVGRVGDSKSANKKEEKRKEATTTDHGHARGQLVQSSGLENDLMGGTI